MAFTLFGMLYTVGAFMIPRASIGNPVAPKIFPLILGIGLSILGSLYTLKEYKQWRDDESSGSTKKFTPDELEKKRKTNQLILFTAIAGIVYAAIFEAVGYILSTSLFIGGIMFAINGRKKWMTNVGVAVIFSVSVYMIFSNLLAIPLPKIPFFEI